MHKNYLPNPILILVKKLKQSLCARNFVENKIFLKDYQKALKKLTLFFFLSSLPFNGQNYEK